MRKSIISFTQVPEREFSRNAQARMQTGTDLPRPGQEVDGQARSSSRGPIVEVPEPPPNKFTLPADLFEVHVATFVFLQLVVTKKPHSAGIADPLDLIMLGFHGVRTWLGQHSYQTMGGCGWWVVGVG